MLVSVINRLIQLVLWTHEHEKAGERDGVLKYHFCVEWKFLTAIFTALETRSLFSLILNLSEYTSQTQTLRCKLRGKIIFTHYSAIFHSFSIEFYFFFSQ